MTVIELIRTRPGWVVLAVDDEVISAEMREVLGDLCLNVIFEVLTRVPDGDQRSPVATCNTCKACNTVRARNACICGTLQPCATRVCRGSSRA